MIYKKFNNKEYFISYQTLSNFRFNINKILVKDNETLSFITIDNCNYICPDMCVYDNNLLMIYCSTDQEFYLCKINDDNSYTEICNLSNLLNNSSQELSPMSLSSNSNNESTYECKFLVLYDTLFITPPYLTNYIVYTKDLLNFSIMDNFNLYNYYLYFNYNNKLYWYHDNNGNVYSCFLNHLFQEESKIVYPLSIDNGYINTEILNKDETIGSENNKLTVKNIKIIDGDINFISNNATVFDPIIKYFYGSIKGYNNNFELSNEDIIYSSNDLINFNQKITKEEMFGETANQYSHFFISEHKLVNNKFGYLLIAEKSGDANTEYIYFYCDGVLTYIDNSLYSIRGYIQLFDLNNSFAILIPKEINSNNNTILAYIYIKTEDNISFLKSTLLPRLAVIN